MPFKRLIFVFGSNTAGRHGKGAAIHAVRFHGANYGQGEGLQGYSYAIPTKDDNLFRLPLYKIQEAIDRFCQVVKEYPEYLFYITGVGTGLAGYKAAQIKPMFQEIEGQNNVIFSPDWFSESSRTGRPDI